MIELELGNFTILMVALSLTLLAVQRTLLNHRWMTIVFLLLPIGVISYRWAVYRDQLQEWTLASVAALVLNLMFWAIFGRSHPPGHKGDILVVGREEE